MKKLAFKQSVGDMVLLFFDVNGTIVLNLVPACKEQDVDFDCDEGQDKMVQLSLLGDARFACYSSGQTMRNSSTTGSLRLQGQAVYTENGRKRIVTIFENDQKIVVENVIEHCENDPYITTYNVMKNDGAESVTVEMFSAFSMSGISPFKEVGDMYIHRLMGNWSAEGRPECRKIESAGLEPSWANWGLRVEKFGSVGSMPVQRYFPFVSLEDAGNQTCWGVFMEAPCSWQMEVTRYNRNISLSGGVADYEYGHVRKHVKAGQQLVTPAAYLTVCRGNVDDVYNRLRTALNTEAFTQKERELPVIYNEYCFSWGCPTHENVIQAAKKAKEYGAEYFVMDAGWYCDSPTKWSTHVGDFVVNEGAFPQGIAETARQIRELGLIPGIWFEFECVSYMAEAYKNDALFLTRDGHRIVAGERAFLDFRKEEVRERLRNKVINFLKENGFGYIKVDYNECIGIGCDGGDSVGHGLMQQIDAVLDFFRELREAIPDIVIESCSSGGHRIEPKFLALADMTSFSDAHEVHEGAVVAANVNRFCPTRKNQIWAVVNDGYSIADIRYTLAKTFFGRMCLSGDVASLPEEKEILVKRFVEFYKETAYILKDDENYYFGNTDLKYRDLIGEQAVLKISKDGSGALAIVHGFKDAKAITMQHPWLEDYEICDMIAPEDVQITQSAGALSVKVGDFDACVFHLKKTV